MTAQALFQPYAQALSTSITWGPKPARPSISAYSTEQHEQPGQAYDRTSDNVSLFGVHSIGLMLRRAVLK